MSDSSSSSPEPALDALGRFAALARSPVPSLGRSCGLIAEHLGAVDGEAATERHLDRFAASVAEATIAAPTLDDVAGHLVDVLGFTGERARYYDRRNSLLPEVLRRRRGIPITLSIVVIEVARRLDLDATGVAMPGHFLVGDGAAPRRWLDPFDGGAWLDVAGARRAFARVHGDAPFDRAYLEPAPPRAILARVLANLLAVLRAEGDAVALLRTAELRAAVPGVGDAPRSQVELAEAYAAVGRLADALAVLEQLQQTVDPRRRPGVQARIDLVRASLS